MTIIHLRYAPSYWYLKSLTFFWIISSLYFIWSSNRRLIRTPRRRNRSSTWSPLMLPRYLLLVNRLLNRLWWFCKRGFNFSFINRKFTQSRLQAIVFDVCCWSAPKMNTRLSIGVGMVLRDVSAFFGISIDEKLYFSLLWAMLGKVTSRSTFLGATGNFERRNNGVWSLDSSTLIRDFHFAGSRKK